VKRFTQYAHQCEQVIAYWPGRTEFEELEELVMKRISRTVFLSSILMFAAGAVLANPNPTITRVKVNYSGLIPATLNIYGPI